MDERLHTCLWIVGCGGFCGLLGGIFGALASALYERNGGAAGTRLARNVVENLLQPGDSEPTPTRHAVLIGAVDGFFFLGLFGLITGMFLGKSSASPQELWLPLLALSLFLVGGAIFFGTMAYVLTYRAAEVLYACAGGILGSILVGCEFGSDYAPAGIVPGMIVGLLLCRGTRG